VCHRPLAAALPGLASVAVSSGTSCRAFDTAVGVGITLLAVPAAAASVQVRVEHTDLGGSFVRPQSGKDVEVGLEHCQQRGVVLSIGLKPRPVRPALCIGSPCWQIYSGCHCWLPPLLCIVQALL
jgi:hypothetical protein